ncbi:protein a6 [Scaptodrosophila lebanonensis]|uniref:Protein a6 n=1 Tax=Drosophila lebanonensis TaxID=7225 RepID=A0A6J2TSK9_DROLE|nr:protein a6 [Scaptodrosophila lebanonensis]
MNHKHSDPFYISPKLFDNKRLKRRHSRWMERLRARKQFYMAQLRSNALASKTEKLLPRRRVAAALPADITIDLLSDDESPSALNPKAVQPPVKAPAPSSSGSFYVQAPASLQLSMVPNITLVPVQVAPAQSSTMLLMPATSSSNHNNNIIGMADVKRQRKAPKPRKRHEHVTSTTMPTVADSIVLTSDDDDQGSNDIQMGMRQRPPQLQRPLLRSPPPLAPLTLSETVEEVTVSLVPRNATTANCYARQQRRRQQALYSPFHGEPNSCSTPTSTSATTTSTANGHGHGHTHGYLDVDVGSAIAATLPDETTVHTVIANRIYELSLSKLREGLASSGVPEYAQDLLPEQLQKLSPAMRAKVAPLVVPSPPVPISLKLSSDLSISLISDDDDCENGNASSSAAPDLVHPVVAAEAHAAAKLLKQQQPQLSVVQHLQYAGPGRGAPVALALPVVAPTASTLPTGRRRKLG